MSMSIFTLLTVVFIVLKLVGVISWDWFVVFLPTIIELLALLLMWLFIDVIE